MSVQVGIGRPNPPLGVGRQVYPVTALIGCIVAIGMGLSQGLVGPSLNGMRQVLGSTAPGWIVPVLINSGALAGMLLLRPLGRVAHLGHVMAASTAVVATSLLAVGVAHQASVLVMSLLVFGIAFGVLAMGWNVTLVGDGSAPRAHAMSNATFGIGILCGPLLYRAVAGTDDRNHRPVFVVVGIVWVALVALMFRAVGPLRDSERRTAERHALHGPLANEHRSHTAVLPPILWAVAALMAFGAVIEATGASFMEDQLRAVGVSGTAPWKAGFWMAYTLSRLVVAVLAAHHPVQRIYTVAVFGGVGVALLGLLTSGAPASLALLGLAIGPLFPMAFVMAARRGARARQMTAIMVCSMLSGALGPVFTGPLLDHPSRLTMSTLMLVLFGAMLTILWVDTVRRPRVDPL